MRINWQQILRLSCAFVFFFHYDATANLRIRQGQLFGLRVPCRPQARGKAHRLAHWRNLVLALDAEVRQAKETKPLKAAIEELSSV